MGFIIEDRVVFVEEVEAKDPHLSAWVMHELGDTSATNFLEPHASWDGELFSLDVEVDVWNLLVLLLSAIASSKSVWHNPAFHTFALDILIHNWVEVFIWNHVQGSSSVSHHSPDVGVESFSTNLNIMEAKFPKLWASNLVELEWSLSILLGIISSKSDLTLTLRVDEHGEEVLLDSSLLVKSWHKQLRSSPLA